MKKIAPGHLKKPLLQSHPPTEGGTISGLTEKNPQGVKTSSGATSVSKHHWDNATVKAEARPEILSFLALEWGILLRVTLTNPPYDTTQTQKGVTSQALQRQNPREEKPRQAPPLYQNITGIMLW